MMAVLFMISGALFGAQLGSIATAYVRGPAIRYVLSYSLILATLGAAMRLVYVLSGQKAPWLSLIAVMLTLGEMIFLCLFIISLLYFARRNRRGAPRAGDRGRGMGRAGTGLGGDLGAPRPRELPHAPEPVRRRPGAGRRGSSGRIAT